MAMWVGGVHQPVSRIDVWDRGLSKAHGGKTVTLGIGLAWVPAPSTVSGILTLSS